MYLIGPLECSDMYYWYVYRNNKKKTVSLDEQKS